MESKNNPPQPGPYLARYQWHNKMNGITFDEWAIKWWNGERWSMFSGAKVIEWRSINENA